MESERRRGHKHLCTSLQSLRKDLCTSTAAVSFARLVKVSSFRSNQGEAEDLCTRAVSSRSCSSCQGDVFLLHSKHAPTSQVFLKWIVQCSCCNACINRVYTRDGNDGFSCGMNHFSSRCTRLVLRTGLLSAAQKKCSHHASDMLPGCTLVRAERFKPPYSCHNL